MVNGSGSFEKFPETFNFSQFSELQRWVSKFFVKLPSHNVGLFADLDTEIKIKALEEPFNKITNILSQFGDKAEFFLVSWTLFVRQLFIWKQFAISGKNISALLNPKAILSFFAFSQICFRVSSLQFYLNKAKFVAPFLDVIKG